MTSETMHTPDETARFVLIKRGLFYRPKAAGYTGRLCEAGRFSEEEAKLRARIPGVEMLPESLAPRHSDRCGLDIKLADETDRLEADNAHLKAENERMRKLLADALTFPMDDIVADGGVTAEMVWKKEVATALAAGE